MINIVVGGINSGKTTRLINIYNKIGYGDGFINKKIYIANIYIGQEIIRLSTDESRIFSLKEEFIPDNWDEKCSYLNYSFSKSGLEFANKIIDDLIELQYEPVFIDEIGPLEIYYEQGLFDAFTRVIACGSRLYVSVRDTCLKDFLNKFNIDGYRLIT